MVSGVSFKNPAEYGKTVSKRRSVPTGLLISFFLLFLSILAYGGVYFLKKSAFDESVALIQTVKDNKTAIATELEGTPALMVGKSQAIRSMLHTDHTTSDLLIDAQKFTVSGVVFKSFDHVYNSDLGVGEITVTADADSYEKIAAQVNEWKKNPTYSRVRVSEISKEDESEFILFTTIMSLNAPAAGPFGENVLGTGSRATEEELIDENSFSAS